MDERLRADGCLPLALGELARGTGLSVHHFVKAIHQTEGQTPYASVLARRVDLPLAFLLQPTARAWTGSPSKPASRRPRTSLAPSAGARV